MGEKHTETESRKRQRGDWIGEISRTLRRLEEQESNKEYKENRYRGLKS